MEQRYSCIKTVQNEHL